jgi:hypothetical protein
MIAALVGDETEQPHRIGMAWLDIEDLAVDDFGGGETSGLMLAHGIRQRFVNRRHGEIGTPERRLRPCAQPSTPPTTTANLRRPTGCVGGAATGALGHCRRELLPQPGVEYATTRKPTFSRSRGVS